MREQQFWQGRANRRRFLGGAALGSTGLASLALVGCGDDDDDAPSNGNGNGNGNGETPAGDPTATPEPTAGGTLVGGQVPDLNMGTGYPFVFLAENPYLNYLPVEAPVRYRDSLDPELVLAERYELNDDFTGLVITLKPDLEFHNGAPVTANDLVFGIELLKDPAAFGITGNFQLSRFAGAIQDFNILSDREVEFTFDKTRPNITDFFAQLNVIHRDSFDDIRNGTAIAGTGPFIFRNWTPGQVLEFEANPNWHHADAYNGGPFLDGVEVRFFGDQDSMGLAYQSGELDLIMGSPANLAANYRDAGLTFNAPKTGLTYMGINVTNPQLEDPRVRQAIFYAIDRERIVNELGEGFGNVTSQPWPETSPAFDPELEGPLYDPDRSRELLAEAGWSQSSPIPFDHRTVQSYVDLASLIQQNLGDVGIKTELLPSDPTAFLGKLRERTFEGFWVTAHSFAHMAPLTNFQQTFPYRIPNISYYESETYLDIIAKLESLDPLSEEALEQYKRFNQLFVEDPWVIPCSETARLDLVSERVQNYGQFFVTPAQGPVLALVSLA